MLLVHKKLNQHENGIEKHRKTLLKSNNSRWKNRYRSGGKSEGLEDEDEIKRRRTHGE